MFAVPLNLDRYTLIERSITLLKQSASTKCTLPILLSLATSLYTIVYCKSKQMNIAKNYEFKKVRKQGQHEVPDVLL